MTGGDAGAEAVKVSIPTVVISSSVISGSGFQADTAPTVPPPAPKPSVDVQGALVVLDSVVLGAPGAQPGFDLKWTTLTDAPCPCPGLTPYNPGFGGSYDACVGGDAVKATSVHHVNSTFTGGQGGKIFNNGIAWGQQPDGKSFSTSTTNVVAIPNVGLNAPWPLRINQYWELAYPNGTPGGPWGPTVFDWSQATLYGAFGLTTPYSIGAPYGVGTNWAFIVPISGALLTPGTTSISTTWPNACGWIGIEVAWQSYDPQLGASRPLLDIFMP
jgi:hypothetical protein